MWTMVIFRGRKIDVGYGPADSMKMQFHYDCKNILKKEIAVVVYEHNGDVQTSKVFENKKWEPVPPDTPDKTNWQIACSK